MEKSNSRARRNGDRSEKGKAKAAAEKIASREETTIINDRASTPGQEAKQRIQSAGEITPIEKKLPQDLQDTFLDERNDVLAVINELEDQLDRQQETRETLERELTGTSEQLQTANQRVQELEWQVVTLQTRVDALEQLRHDVTSLEEEINDANARIQRSGEQVARADKEQTRLKTELKAANKQIDELWPIRKERDSLHSDCRLLSAKVDELERNQRDAIEQRTQVQTELQEAHIRLEEITNERNELQIGRRGAEDRVRELTQVQESLGDKIETLRTEKKNLQAQITHLERENARLIEQRQFYECEVTSLRNQSRISEAALSSVKKAFGEVRVALTETKSRARRRTLDTWPRIGTTLHGISAEPPADQLATRIAEPVAITAGTDDKLIIEETSGAETPRTDITDNIATTAETTGQTDD